jgi:hypothetical protein
LPNCLLGTSGASSIVDINGTIFDELDPRSVYIQTSSAVFKSAEAHIADLMSEASSGKLPVVLWNISPSDHFTTLHAIYAEALRELSSKGFNCVVTIFDRYSQEYSGALPKEARQIRRNCDRLTDALLSLGLVPSRSEFILESNLRDGCNPHELLAALSRLAKALDDDPRAGPESRTSFDTLSTLLELYYASIIGADLVLGGVADAAGVWGAVRQAASQNDPSHNSTPAVAAFPMLCGLDGSLLNPHIRNNTICALDSPKEINAKLNSSNFEFIKLLYYYVLLPHFRDLPRAPEGGLSLFAEQELRAVVADKTPLYFQSIGNKSYP